jgi:hypothetical protein
VAAKYRHAVEVGGRLIPTLTCIKQPLRLLSLTRTDCVPQLHHQLFKISVGQFFGLLVRHPVWKSGKLKSWRSEAVLVPLSPHPGWSQIVLLQAR